MRHSDDNILFLDQVFNPDFIVEVSDFSSPCVAKLVFDFNQFGLDKVKSFQLIGK